MYELLTSTMEQSVIHKVLRENFELLRENLNPDETADGLWVSQCITKEERSKIQTGSERFGKNRRLLNILIEKDDKWLNVLAEIIFRNGSQRKDKVIENLEASATKFGFNIEFDRSPKPKSAEETSQISQTWWPNLRYFALPASFIERVNPTTNQSVIETLHESLYSTSSMTTLITAKQQAIAGMGGVGKSTTAKWFADTYQAEYEYLIWIDSEGAALEVSCRGLASRLGISTQQSPLTYMMTEIYEHLKERKCLLIFDNAERYDGENGLKHCLPYNSNEKHHVLITSRNREWGSEQGWGKIATFALDVFSPADSNKFLLGALSSQKLQSTSYNEIEGDCSALGEELGYLPLALQLAVAAINKSSLLTIATYLERVRANMKPLINSEIVLDDYERSIMVTLSITIQQIEQNEQCGTICKQILQVAAYCEADKIPKELFTRLPGPGVDLVGIYGALDELVNLSLLSERNVQEDSIEVVSIHRLLQHVLRYRIGVANETIGSITSALTCFRSTDWDTYKRHIISVWAHGMEIDQILKQFHHFPNTMGYNDDSSEFYLRFEGQNSDFCYDFLEPSIAKLKRVFEETDERVIRLEIRLIQFTRVREGYSRAEKLYKTLDSFAPSTEPKALTKRVLLLFTKVVLANLTWQLKCEGPDREYFQLYEAALEELGQLGSEGIEMSLQEVSDPVLGFFHHIRVKKYVPSPIIFATTGLLPSKNVLVINYAEALAHKGHFQEAATLIGTYLKEIPVDLVQRQYMFLHFKNASLNRRLMLGNPKSKEECESRRSSWQNSATVAFQVMKQFIISRPKPDKSVFPQTPRLHMLILSQYLELLIEHNNLFDLRSECQHIPSLFKDQLCDFASIFRGKDIKTISFEVVEIMWRTLQEILDLWQKNKIECLNLRFVAGFLNLYSEVLLQHSYELKVIEAEQYISGLFIRLIQASTQRDMHVYYGFWRVALQVLGKSAAINHRQLQSTVANCHDIAKQIAQLRLNIVIAHIEKTQLIHEGQVFLKLVDAVSRSLVQLGEFEKIIPIWQTNFNLLHLYGGMYDLVLYCVLNESSTQELLKEKQIHSILVDLLKMVSKLLQDIAEWFPKMTVYEQGLLRDYLILCISTQFTKLVKYGAFIPAMELAIAGFTFCLVMLNQHDFSNSLRTCGWNGLERQFSSDLGLINDCQETRESKLVIRILLDEITERFHDAATCIIPNSGPCSNSDSDSDSDSDSHIFGLRLRLVPLKKFHLSHILRNKD